MFEQGVLVESNKESSKYQSQAPATHLTTKYSSSSMFFCLFCDTPQRCNYRVTSSIGFILCCLATAQEATHAVLTKQGYLVQGKEENCGLLLSSAESWLSRQQKEEEGLSSNLSIFSQITARTGQTARQIEFLNIFD